MEKLTQGHIRLEHARFDMSQNECDNKICASTQFLQLHRNQLIDLQIHLELFLQCFTCVSFQQGKKRSGPNKSYLLPIRVNEWDIEPTVIKKANQLISFNFGDIQLMDILNFLGWATSLDSFLKAYKTSETKGFFCPTNGLITLTKCRIQNFPHMTPFTVNFVNVTLLKPNTRTMLIYWKVDVVAGQFIVFTRKTVVDETFIRRSANICKPVVWIDASQINLEMSTHASWFLYALGLRFRNE